MSEAHVAEHVALVDRPDTSRRPRRFPALVAVIALLLAALASCALLRSFELDEGYSVMLLDGRPQLDWPAGIFTRSDVAGWFDEQGPIGAIPRNLRAFDVHPPLWFCLAWGWRALFGSGLVVARLLSVLLTCLDLAVFLALARRLGAPAAPAAAIGFLSYVVVYTGSTLRMYPLGLLFLLLGTLGLLRALQAPPGRAQLGAATAAGLCFGLGILTHMLVLFPSLAMCAVAAGFLLRRRRLGAVAALAAAPLPFLAWTSTFFLVQDRRDWQFPPFHALQMLGRLAQNEAAALLGGTPLYFAGATRLAASGLLALLFAAVVVAAVASFVALRREPGTCVVAAGAATMPCALFGLGLAFHHQASEPRYMLYGIPFLALLLARGLSRQRLLPPRAASALLACLLAAELAGTAGLVFSRSMQQDARPAMAEIARQWTPDAILLLPEAADTTGMTIDYLFEAPPRWPLALVRHDVDAPALLPLLRGRTRLFQIVFADGVGEAAVRRTSALLAAQGWRDAGSPGGVVSKRGLIWREYVRPPA